MELNEAKSKFINTWGMLGSQWGINRTMSQIYALLLITPGAISADDIMEQLSISRGNANMNLRALLDWGLIYKELRPGERREFFLADKDIWKAAKTIMEQRKKRELEPVIKVLTELSQEVSGEPKEVAEFKTVINDLNKFSMYADNLLQTMMMADRNWMFNSFFKNFFGK
ncbi:MAG: transcriptional regulator [Sphingobacteriales bacterium]|jgi:DNA-binding transcriptional regulator GbsR (MarR family)|nr:transcriptional regulator [Sphingobacteriales bacterium]MBP9141668.1 transcriptional regulator [Chitinophagales bacterium]MDA0197479.1 transcriptional regulator [Bacteroidota bacterium]MBK6890334.1 transcriptional regulator [Sphingobacteriales bacterium]MBK7526613.1 transcriptional regulator [Sphingobacteriales bacterium]